MVFFKVTELIGRWILEDTDSGLLQQLTEKDKKKDKKNERKASTQTERPTRRIPIRPTHGLRADSDSDSDVNSEGEGSSNRFAGLSDSDSDSDNETGTSLGSVSDKESNGEASNDEEEGPHTGKKREEIEEIGMLLELSMLELLLTCDDERHAKWEMVNTTGRKFINPFLTVREYMVDQDGLYFFNEEGSEFLKLDPAFDAQGHLSLARDDGGIIILQKVLEAPTAFSLTELLLGNQPYADVSLLCADKKTLSAHAVIISARCPELLEPAGLELVAATDSKAVSGLLHYIYSDGLPDQVTEYVRALQSMATHFKLHRLETLCEENFQNNAVKNGIFPQLPPSTEPSSISCPISRAFPADS